MRETKTYLVVTFHTTAGAMEMEACARDGGIPGKLISAPRNVSHDCGIAFRADPEDRQRLEDLIRQEDLEVEGTHLLEL